MTDNILRVGPEILAVVGGMIVLFLFAVTLGLSHRSKTLPGSSGHRPAGESGEHEEIRADGYIDSFAGEIEEAGGGMPPVVKLALPGILIWWFLYLILNWTLR
ncbi:MAG: hypothetical protein P8X64_15210 [Anaerolineales bacterium]|jgi:hypothetical protein